MGNISSFSSRQQRAPVATSVRLLLVFERRKGRQLGALEAQNSAAVQYSPEDGVQVPGLFRHLSRDLVGPHRVFIRWLTEANVRAEKTTMDAVRAL